MPPRGCSTTSARRTTSGCDARVLLEYRIAKESAEQAWTANELETLAQLFERLPDVNEAARLYYALYSVAARRAAAHAERALYGLANLLLTAPDQPIQFGSGDLSFYKDIATVDPSPGFLNGILSLVLNWTGAALGVRAAEPEVRGLLPSCGRRPIGCASGAAVSRVPVIAPPARRSGLGLRGLRRRCER